MPRRPDDAEPLVEVYPAPLELPCVPEAVLEVPDVPDVPVRVELPWLPDCIEPDCVEPDWLEPERVVELDPDVPDVPLDEPVLD